MAYITLSKSAFFHNLDIIAEKTKSVEKVALVLKDNAYGHGLETMARLASEYGVTKAVVRSADEAEVIRNYFEYILVLADIPHQSDEHICFTVNALEQISRFPKGCRVELKVDSGMHRNGITIGDLDQAFKAIHDAGLLLEGVFTHQRSADTLSSEWYWQTQNFQQIKNESRRLCEAYGWAPLRYHSCNSASLFRSMPEDEAFARIGIAAYGCLEMDRTLVQPQLKPVMSLWGEKIATRELETSMRVGYNGTYEAHQRQRVSTYDVGYADGLHRALSNRYCSPEGNALLGRVSMDNVSFEGDADALLIFNDANVMAKSADTIGYEILVGMRSHMRRNVVE